MAGPLEPDDPRRLGEFTLAGRLGQGGQGVVYLAHSPAGEPVAVKVLLRDDAEARERLSRELAAMESVASFCIARVLTASLDPPRPYVVSEFVDGPSLDARVRERGPLRGGELERLVVGTATALAAIHSAGVVHRDFKPANVLLGPDGARVVDFGIARARDSTAMTSVLIGTPAYFAPEQIAGEVATPASDVFAWAATMLFAATGRSPFAAGTIPATLQRIVSHEPDLSEVPPSLREVLAAALAKDPGRRPASHEALARLIGAAPAAGQEIAGVPATEPAGPALQRSRTVSPAVVAVTAAVVAAVVAVAVGVWLGVDRERDTPAVVGGTSTPAAASTPSEPRVTATSRPTSGESAGPGATPRPTATGPGAEALATDRFEREVSDGFGRADLGGEWLVGDPAGAYSVDEGAGRIGISEPGSGRSAYLGELSSPDTDLAVTLGLGDKPLTGKGLYASAVGRKIAGAGTYRAVVTFRPDGGTALELRRSDGEGAETAISGEQIVPEVSSTAAVRVRVQVTGTSPTTLRAKVWQAGGAEPAWQLSATDSTPALQAPGGAGLLAFLSASATDVPVTLTVDDLDLTEPAG
ncbi:serine/threonine-protein kinase [Streptosporangium sp. KLBMP 9127]|nr:protein kinase [Streptosporangium sp. KLBMP 9127]